MRWLRIIRLGYGLERMFKRVSYDYHSKRCLKNWCCAAFSLGRGLGRIEEGGTASASYRGRAKQAEPRLASRPTFPAWGSRRGSVMSAVNGKAHLVPAVAYLRRSTDKQEASISEQHAAVQKHADEKGYDVLRWYTDDAISGDDTKKRKAFLQMVTDAKDRGDFKAIICWDQSRFGRFDSIEAGYYIYPLREAGVCLVTVMEGVTDWNDSTGRIVGGVKQEGKHQWLIDHSATVARGQLGAAKNGSWLGSPPYGYQIVGEKKAKRLALGDPGHVRIVQRIFHELVEERRSMGNIADRLNDDGMVSPGGRFAKRAGKPWQYDTIRVIVTNPAYCGDYAGARYSYGKYHTIGSDSVAKGKRRCAKPESQWIVRRDHHDPIIDRATWDKAQAILAKGKSGHPRKPPEENQYLFAGLLRCGKCGCPLWGTERGKYNHYECALAHQNRKGRDYKNGSGEDRECEGTAIREDKIVRSIADYLDAEFLSLDGEALAWKADRKELTATDLPKAFAKLKRMIAPPKEPVANRQRNEKQAKVLDGQIEKARRNLVLLDADNIPAAQDEIRRLRSERALLEAELKKRPPTESDLNSEVMSILRTLYWLGIYFRLHADPMDPENAEEHGGASLIGDFAPAIRHWLRDVSAIVIHTRKNGTGYATRHAFIGGEIAFREAGANGISLNPHHHAGEPH
jgi:site-specific DNA recombinase